jgi:hypothetical protein
MGPMALLPLRRKTYWGDFRSKIPTASARCAPANLSTKGQHATSRPPKPVRSCSNKDSCFWKDLYALSRPSLRILRSCTHDVQVNGILLITRYSWYVPRAMFLNVCSKRIFLVHILGKRKGKTALFRVRNSYRRCRKVFLYRRSAARYLALHQLYRAARFSPGIRYFRFPNIFH